MSYGPARFDFPALHVHVGFWYKLEQMKLDVFMLDDSPKPLSAWYGSSDVVEGTINIDGDSFKEGTMGLADRMTAATVLITNTVEEYRARDRKALLATYGQNCGTASKPATPQPSPRSSSSHSPTSRLISFSTAWRSRAWS